MVGRDNTPFTHFLQQQNVPYDVVPYNSKADLLPTFYKIFRILRRTRPHVVHVHLFYAGIIALPAAWLAGVRSRIYTRHYSSYHHDYFKKGVVLDKIINFLSTRLVSISQVVEDVLVTREHVAPEKITRIPHGFDFSYFVRRPEEIEAVRIKHGVPAGQHPVIGVISRYTHPKGIQYTIEAFATLRHHYPQAHLVLSNASGDYKAVLSAKLQALPPGSYTEILFEENVRALYALFDVFVHVPITPDGEAFGQIYVEALAMRVPSVFTLSGIAREFVEDGVNARVVPYQDAAAIAHAIQDLLQQATLRERVTAQGYADVTQRFGMPVMIERLDAAYQAPSKIRT
jgi:glycosyltransferase involved in cell wall biosynthesis